MTAATNVTAFYVVIPHAVGRLSMDAATIITALQSANDTFADGTTNKLVAAVVHSMCIFSRPSQPPSPPA